MKKIALLGSSGSIGKQTLNVVRRFPESFKIVALTVNQDIDTLKSQIDEFRPSVVGVCDENSYKAAIVAIKDTRVLGGAQCLSEIAAESGADVVVAAVVGMCGLSAVMAALERGTQVALANKESLVAGGRLVTEAAAKAGKELLPIDSEHSAVWQCLKSGDRSEVARIILTASGGSFYGKDREFLKSVTSEMAIKHPNWSMGKKISVDSSTMMNKALELIEARWLFDTEKIDYIIHPQSVIHSMVEYTDGSVIAQMSAPNMELPIQLALTYPNRLPLETARFSFDKTLSFSAPDEQNFPLPKLAREVMKKDGNLPCVFNAANEACVELFLNNKIGFCDISIIIEAALEKAEFIARPSINDIYDTHENVYAKLMRDYNGYSELK